MLEISPYKYLLVPSLVSPICTMKSRYQYIVRNLYSQGRFAEKQNLDFCFVPQERSQSVVVKMKLILLGLLQFDKFQRVVEKEQ